MFMYYTWWSVNKVLVEHFELVVKWHDGRDSTDIVGPRGSTVIRKIEAGISRRRFGAVGYRDGRF